MTKDFGKLLSQVGLLPSESKVYLSALELGPSTVQNIAAKAGISRTAAYEAIELLQRRGLMTASMLGKRNVFSAEDPDRIVSYLKSEQEKFAATVHDIERSADALRMLAGGVRPTVKVYEGEEALYVYFDHIAAVNPKEWMEISNADDVYTHIDEKTLIAARKPIDKLKVENVRVLYRGRARNPRSGANLKQLDEMFGDFHGNIAIFENYIAMSTYIGKVVCVIIESSALAGTMRVLFNMAWKAQK